MCKTLNLLPKCTRSLGLPYTDLEPRLKELLHVFSARRLMYGGWEYIQTSGLSYARTIGNRRSGWSCRDASDALPPRRLCLRKCAGSDFPFVEQEANGGYGPNLQAFHDLLDRLGLEDADVAAVMGGTARGLFFDTT